MSQPDDSSSLRRALAHAHEAYWKGQPHAAEAELVAVAARCELAGQDGLLAWCLATLALVQRAAGQSEAVWSNTFRRAVSASESSKDEPEARADISMRVALVARQLGATDAAIQIFECALGLVGDASSLEVPRARAASLLASTLMDCGRVQEALAHLSVAVEIRRRISPATALLFGDLVKMTDCYQRLGLMENARHTLMETLDVGRVCFGHDHANMSRLEKDFAALLGST